MANMIPSALSTVARVPIAEREIFSALEMDRAESASWTVMHSLDIRWHICKLEGEADFLVLAPGLGVMVVEVKGCRVSRQQGTWTYHYDNPKRSPESPFAQARSAMHSLRKWLERKQDLDAIGLRNWKNWVWHSCAVFTEIDFNLAPAQNGDDLEWRPSEVVSAREINAGGIAVCLVRALKLKHQELAAIKKEEQEGGERVGSRSARWYDNHKSRPSREEMDSFASLLRPDLCFEEDGVTRIRRVEEAIADATRSQTDVALGLLGNDRVIIKGAAGTGKTFIALRMAKYFAQTKLRVGFFCFNSLLAEWLKAQLAHDLGAEGYVGTLSKLLLELAGATPPVAGSADFWNEELPRLASEKLIDGNVAPRFDVLFVDEAQDLLKEPMLDVLDLLLDKGLKGGRWVFAGDFSGQAIYEGGADEQGLLARLSQKGIAQFTFSLHKNCRNAPAIHGGIRALGFGTDLDQTGLQQATPGLLRPHFVEGEAARIRKLRELLVELRGRFSPENIVVLSALADGSSAAKLASELGSNLRKLDVPKPPAGYSGYSTIHAFKGLDAQAVLVTDLASLDGMHEALLYTGMSRGRVEVHILLDARLQGDYQRRLLS